MTMITSSQRRQRKQSIDPIHLALCIGGISLIIQLFFWGRVQSQRTKQSPTSPPGPILIMGLPRSGSLTLHNYFMCNGKKSAHYCCGEMDTEVSFPCKRRQETCGTCVLENLKQHKPAFEACTVQPMQVWSQFDVETNDAWFLPQSFSLGLLHEAYPDATWILNTRNDSRKWAESVLHWHSITRRLFASYDLDFYPHPIEAPPDATAKITTQELEVAMTKALEERVYNQTELSRKRNLLERLYENHTQKIQWWARQFPSHQLIEVNVDDDEASLQTLNRVFGYGTERTSCGWKFDPPGNDWKDFSLPFDT